MKSPVNKIERQVILSMAFTVCTLWLLGKGASPSQEVAQVLPNATGAWALAIFSASVLILFNAAFVAGETAMNLLRNGHVKHLREKDGAKADRLQKLIDERSRLLAASAFGAQLCRACMAFAAFFIAPDIALMLSGKVGISGYGLLLVSAIIAYLPIALINLAVGELAPKSYAALHPHLVALVLGRFLTLFAILFAAPTGMVTWLAGLVTARFGGRATFNVGQAEEEIKTIVESAQETGEIEDQEKELLHSVFEFTDTVAREVMTPRVDMDALPVKSEALEVIELIQKSGHTRIPLYDNTDDQIVGIVHAKDLLIAQSKTKNVSLRDLMRPAFFVPENKNLNELLTEMRSKRNQMAVVQDEFGGTAGIVTIEDIVEELVGEIVDEYDVEEPEIVPSENGFLVGGKAHVDDVNHAMGSSFDSEEFDTIGGYVFGLFGRQPKPNESVEADGHKFQVINTDGRRIHRLFITKISVPSEAAESI